METLANNLKQAIEDVYQKKYVGVLRLTKLKPIGYSVSLYLQSERPINIAAQIENQQEFIKFFKKEMRERSLDSVKYFTGYKSQPYDYKCEPGKSDRVEIKDEYNVIIYPCC